MHHDLRSSKPSFPQHFKQLDFAAEPVPSPLGGPLAAVSWQIMPLQAGTTHVPEAQSLAKPAESFLPRSLHTVSIWLTTSLFSSFLAGLLWDVTLPGNGFWSPAYYSFLSKPLYTELAWRKKGLSPKTLLAGFRLVSIENAIFPEFDDAFSSLGSFKLLTNQHHEWCVLKITTK